jgi:RNA polymerase sigma-70 factor (ECF subfamily)
MLGENQASMTAAAPIEEAMAGSEEALNELIVLYQKRVAGFVLGLTGERDAVDDLTQSIFFGVARSIGKLRQPERFEPWLFQIARNACLSYLRRRKWRSLFVPFSPSDHERAAEEESSDDDAERLRIALQKLPTSQRDLVCLLFEGSYSYEELAALTRSTIASVRSRLHRAKRTLRRVWHEA